MLCHLLVVIGAVVFLAKAGVLESVFEGDMDGTL